MGWYSPVIHRAKTPGRQIPITCAHRPPKAVVQTPRHEIGRSSAVAKGRRGILSAIAVLIVGKPHPANADLACGGMRGYALRECLREVRKQKEGQEAASPESVREEFLKTRQFEQPGELVTLPSGIQYREILEGQGRDAKLGSVCNVSYIVYRLSSGAYFKYSSGGTPVYLYSLGYGYEGKDDVGNTYQFILGEGKSLPVAAVPAVIGMKEGGRRRILVPPSLGWVNDDVGPRPDNFGGYRRLVGHRDEPLLLEVEIKRVREPSEAAKDLDKDAKLPGLKSPFKLPAPPSPFKSKLG